MPPPPLLRGEGAAEAPTPHKTPAGVGVLKIAYQIPAEFDIPFD